MRQLVVTFMLLLFSSESLSTENTLTIGHIEHPKVVNIYKNIIYNAYQDIGIKAKFTQVGAQQGLRLLNEGLTDADVIRYKNVTSAHNNILIVEPPLVVTNITLYYFQLEKCDQSILFDKNNVIGTTIVSLKNSHNQVLNIDVQAQIMVFDSYSKVAELMKNGRIKYGILPTENNQLKGFSASGFTHFNLGSHNAYHVINQKHQHLISDLSKAIKQQLHKKIAK